MAFLAKEAALRRGRDSVMASASMTVESLHEGQEAEVLAFLAANPLDTFYQAGLVRDNGLVSPLNRGTFYGCRDAGRALVGVALIGHVTQVEARTPAALEAFARLAQGYPSAHVIMGRQETLKTFWGHYAAAGQALRLSRRELLLARERPARPGPAGGFVCGLRLATLEDLPLVMPVQAEMAFAECGIDPMVVDPAGFRRRYSRRIERRRVWVSTSGGRLAFKADIMSETPEVIYLEGVYVSSRERGKGYGLRCMAQLEHALLARAKALCLLVGEHNREAVAFYHRAGFTLRSYYDTLYLQREDDQRR